MRRTGTVRSDPWHPYWSECVDIVVRNDGTEVCVYAWDEDWVEADYITWFCIGHAGMVATLRDREGGSTGTTPASG